MFRLSRGTLAWLLLAQLLVVVPLLSELTWWMIPVCLAGAGWRLLAQAGRVGAPPLVVKLILVALSVGAVLLGYGNPVGLEPAVSLLVAAYYLKLLEIRRIRDLHIVVCLSFFLLATHFIFDQSIGTGAYAAIVVAVVMAVLVHQSQGDADLPWWAPLRVSGILLLHAVPMTLVLFLFFPRVAPLWSVPMPSASTRTGLSETVSTRNIAELSQSGELAFRVMFDGEPPPQNALYWRTLTYTRYRDGAWRQPEDRDFAGLEGTLVSWGGRRRMAPWLEGARLGRSVEYTVIAEAHQRPWLYALDAPAALTPGTGVGRDFRLFSRAPVTSTLGYRVSSSLDYRYDPRLPAWLARLTLELPDRENPRTVRLGRRLRAEAETPEAFVARVLALFGSGGFSYTLEPEPLEGDEIDGFLFQSRRGFCAHYAGAFVMLMRAGGVPARMVGGYQGGEWNASGRYLNVRQYDAHAWAEVWLQGRGWTRVDPTSRVAPERIELGMEQALASETFLRDSPDVADRLRRLMMFSDLVGLLDSLDHRWNLWVVGYDRARQESWLRQVLGGFDVLRIAAVLLGAAVVTFALVALWPALRRGPHRRPPELRLARAFGTLGGRRGGHREPRETLPAYALRLARGAPPGRAAALQELAGRLTELVYNPALEDREARLRAAARDLRRLRLPELGSLEAHRSS